MNDLLEQGQSDQAVVVYRDNVTWFREHAHEPAVSAVVNCFADQQYVRRASDVVETLHFLASCPDPAEVSRWPEAREILISAKSLYAELTDIPPFEDLRYRPAPLVNLQSMICAVELQYKNMLLFSFIEHSLDENVSFFFTYPSIATPESFFAEYQTKIEAWIRDLSLDDVLRTQQRYGQWLPDVCKNALAARVFVLDSDPITRPGLQGWMHSFGLVRDMGLADSVVPKLKVVFVHATSPVVFERKMLAFPVAVQKDLNVVTAVADDKRPFEDRAVHEADVVVSVAVLLSRCRRFVENCEGREYVNGMQVRTMTSDDFNEARQTVLGDWGTSENLEGRDTEERDALERAEDWFFGEDEGNATDEKDREGVWFQVYDVQCEKTATMSYCIYDKATHRMFADHVDIRSLSGFQVAGRKKLQGISDISFMPDGTVDQKIVADFEKEPVEIPLSVLFADAVGEMCKWRHADLEDVKHVMNESAPVVTEMGKYDVVLPTDKRFASIVQVEAGRRKGSGFYVDDDIVITALRVVSDRELASVWLWDGSKIHGSVVARDARTGLALVRVQQRGVPVRLHQGRSLPAGARVTAFGYAKHGGVTALSGVVGTVRRYGVGERGAGAAWVVQTDCPLKKETVGGPLFLGDEVIGLTCNAQPEMEDGLSFAVHHFEIADFIRHAGFDFVTGGE